MSFREYAQVFFKRWWLILLVAFVASAGAYAASKLQQPLFRSTLKLYVSPARPDYGGVLTIKDIIRQYGQLIQSDRILQQVIDNLRLDLKPETLRLRLSSSGTPDNQAILLTVDHPDPGMAPRIAGRPLPAEDASERSGRRHLRPRLGVAPGLPLGVPRRHAQDP